MGGNSLGAQLGFSLTWKVVLAAQLFCWTVQFVGHGVFEVTNFRVPRERDHGIMGCGASGITRRAPALLDNLSQALLMAPFCVLLEMFCGYEPYPGFHVGVEAKIETEIKDWQEKKQKKIS